MDTDHHNYCCELPLVILSRLIRIIGYDTPLFSALLF